MRQPAIEVRSLGFRWALGSGVWTTAESTGLPKPEMRILVGSSLYRAGRTSVLCFE
jgi:hypothetical protein